MEIKVAKVEEVATSDPVEETHDTLAEKEVITVEKVRRKMLSASTVERSGM